MRMFFQYASLPGTTHRSLVILVARPEEDMFKTISEAIWHVLSTAKVVLFQLQHCYKYAGPKLKIKHTVM